MLKKISAEKILDNIDERFKKSNQDLLESINYSNFKQVDLVNEIEQFQEQNKILKEHITSLEKLHQKLGIEKKFCPICNSEFIAYLPFGEDLRANAKCPNCSSLERHRATYLFLKKKTHIFKDKIKFLHIAPEKKLYDLFSQYKNIDYLTTDINDKPPHVMEKMDIQNIQYRDNSFDFN